MPVQSDLATTSPLHHSSGDANNAVLAAVVCLIRWLGLFLLLCLVPTALTALRLPTSAHPAAPKIAPA
jgi:hypothetical protein